jgi:hypothetical protein
MSVPEKEAMFDLASEHNKLRPERINNLNNKSDKTRHEQALEYDTCFGLVYSLIYLIEAAC